ncbi:MAG: hypothetical protein QMC67_16855 [Candidatus Wallbacteria bacterium]
MIITEPFEIALMILKKPAETYQRFYSAVPRFQTFMLYLVIWVGISAYSFSYLNFENDLSKFYQYLTFSVAGGAAVLFFFWFISLIVYLNARILKGEAPVSSIFYANLYTFLSIFIYLTLPTHLLNMFLIPDSYEYWFSIITRVIVVISYLTLLTTAISKIFKISLIKGFISWFMIIIYLLFFAGSSYYISKIYNIPLF